MLSIYLQSLNRIFMIVSLEFSMKYLLVYHCRSTRVPVRLYSLLSLFIYVRNILWLSSYPEKLNVYLALVNDSLCCSLVTSGIISAIISGTAISILPSFMLRFLRNSHLKPSNSKNSISRMFVYVPCLEESSVGSVTANPLLEVQYTVVITTNDAGYGPNSTWI